MDWEIIINIIGLLQQNIYKKEYKHDISIPSRSPSNIITSPPFLFIPSLDILALIQCSFPSLSPIQRGFHL